MKMKLMSVFLFSLFLSQVVLADDSCTVIGLHEPNSQTYDGSTFCSNVTIKNIIVRGELTVTDSRLKGNTEVTGPIFAKHTLFDAITIKNPTSRMIVSLKNQSVDIGNLDFKGAKGFYVLDKTSHIYGQIINATLSPGA